MYYHDDDPERTWITLNIDSYKAPSKPKAVSSIRYRLGQKAAIKTITPDYLIAAIEHGQTFNAGKLEGGQSKENWKEQRLICLDIDNTGDRHLTPDEALNLLHTYEIDPRFMYYSFSSTPDHPKFRIVCVLDKPMTDPDEAEKLTKRLIDIANRECENCADTRCSDPPRLFFGSTPNSVFYKSKSITTLDTFRDLPPADDEVKKQAPEHEGARPSSDAQSSKGDRPSSDAPTAPKAKRPKLDIRTRPDLPNIQAQGETWVNSHLKPAPKAGKNFYACVCGSSDALEVTPIGGGRIKFHCFSDKHAKIGLASGDFIQLVYMFTFRAQLLKSPWKKYLDYAKELSTVLQVPLIRTADDDFKTPPPPSSEFDPDTHYPIFTDGYICTKDGEIRARDYNYQVYLITEHLIDNLYFDTFSQSFINGDTYINDSYFLELYGDTVNRRFFNGDVNKDKFIAQIMYLVKKYHTVNRARLFFDSLVWDGVERLDRLLIDQYGADNTALTRESLKMWLTAAVKRVYSDEPVQFDYVLMLEGKTGTYKTSFFEALGMHGTEGRHFCNALEKQYINNPRSFALNMLGKLICYDGDLKVLQDIRSSDIKGFITRTYDTFDNKYDRMQTTVNRQFVIAADTNETAFLDDVTGNRRYIVIHIDKGCPYFHSANWRKVVTDDGLTGCNYIYQLWAEAVHSYKADPEQRLDLSDEAKKLQKGVNELYSNEGIEPFYDDIVIEAAKLYNETHNVRLTDMQKTLGRPKTEFIDGGILERFTGKQQIEIIKKCLAKAGYKRQTKRLDDGGFTKVLAPDGMPDKIDIPDYSYNKALETDENWLD